MITSCRFQHWFRKISFLIFQRIRKFLLNQPYFLQLEFTNKIYLSRRLCCLLPVENTINDSSNLDTHICPCLLRQHADKFLPRRKKLEPYYVCRVGLSIFRVMKCKVFLVWFPHLNYFLLWIFFLSTIHLIWTNSWKKTLPDNCPKILSSWHPNHQIFRGVPNIS